MSEVWKYRLVIDDEQEIEMPKDAELLHVAEQHGRIALWALVIPTGQPTAKRVIVIRGTGDPFWTQPYVGTVLMESGLVWHVFDGGENVS